MNYGELLVAVADELSAPDISVVTNGAKVNLALQRAQRAHTFLSMEALVSFSVVSGQDQYTLSSVAPRYKEAIKLWTEDGSGGRHFIQRLESKARLLEKPDFGLPPTPLHSVAASSSQFYIVDGTALNFYPAPTDNLTAYFLYARYFPLLSGATDTNWITDNYPEIVIYGAAAEVARLVEYLEKIPLYDSLYQRALGEAISRDESERNSNLDFFQSRLPDLGFRISRS